LDLLGSNHLLLALAALLAVGSMELNSCHDLSEGRHVLSRDVGRLGSLDHGSLDVRRSAWAATLSGESNSSRGLVLAGGLLADKLALGARAHERLAALPVAVGSLAERSALRLGSNASGVADWGRADSLALGAVILLAERLGAANRASGLLAVHIALGAGKLLALHLALGACADGVAHSRACWVIIATCIEGGTQPVLSR